MKIVNALAALAAFCLLAAAAPAAPAAAERTVVVVLFDGFAPAMLDAAKTPNFDAIARGGVSSRHLVPAFPTVSMINHTTFATGCWPSHHGIMSNRFWDPKRGLYNSSDDADWRTGCETMWEAAERQGLRSAALDFTSRWSSKTGKRATVITPEVPWTQHLSDEKVLAEALRLLKDNGPNHPRLIALYFPIPDEEAHPYGVTAPQTEADVREADRMVGQLMAAIKALPPGREGTLVIGTDHGMTAVTTLINAARLMHEYGIEGREVSTGASAFLYLKHPEEAAALLPKFARDQALYTAYRKGAFPVYAHMGEGPRVPDIMLVTHPPYYFVGAEVMPWWGNLLGVNYIWPAAFKPPFGMGVKATHGFSPELTAMHGIFFAWGAGVAKGKVLERLDQVDIAPTVLTLLGLKPSRPEDGKPLTALLAP